MTRNKATLSQAKNISGETPKRFELTQQRIWFTVAVDNKMRQLRGRTGITPNVLARFGFCLSLEEQGEPADPFGSGRFKSRTEAGDGRGAKICRPP